MLIDSHCHLYLGSWKDDLSSVISNSKDNDVDYFICPGIDIETSTTSIEIAAQHDAVFAAAGIHPHDAKDAPVDYIDNLKVLSNNDKVVAIGEIGLDFYRNISDPTIQFDVFRKQLELAQDINLPVIIHNRNADEEIIRTLKDFQPVNGVAHCFSSDIKTANKFLEMGLYISFAGNLTYKNSNLPEVVKEIPLNKILIETDSPYLTPVPFRGKENDPSRVRLVAEKIAEIKNIRFDKVADATSKNTKTLFNLPTN